MRWLIAGAAVLVAVLSVEVGLRAAGLGRPILYDNRLAWGYRPRPSQSGHRLGGARVTVNALGLRGPEVAVRRPPGTTRVLFLGDSVTWGGSYVDDDALFSAVAGGTLAAARPGRRVEALNAGVNGWGPQNLRGLVRVTGGFDSNVWVVTALTDDFWREKTHLGEVPYFARAPRSAWEELLVLAAYRVLATYKVPKPAADYDRLGRRNLAAYRAVATAGRRRGVRVLVVWHPTAPALGGQAEPWKPELAAAIADTGAAWLDLLPAYRSADQPPHSDGMHLSAAGHTVAGRAIGAALASLAD